ncbi:MAG: type IV pilin protein [Gammaproteobacteria bacterium]|nr:type IV pilin protein [Gammaproteobacteria bacterium]
MNKVLQSGWLLMEILLALSLLGIVYTLVLPSYQQYLMTMRRTQGKNALFQASYWLEKNALIHGTYPENLAPAIWQPPDVAYTISYIKQDHGYLLMAIPKLIQHHDPCGKLTINHTGEKGVVGNTLPLATCWSQSY